jgi:hypothetical protein
MRHATHLFTRYVHDQLRPALRAQVINHVRVCPSCRAGLAREEELAADLRREMPLIGRASPAQLTRVWAGVWQEVNLPRSGGSRRLPGLSLALAVLLVIVMALPLMTQGEVRAGTDLKQPRPYTLATASPTPGITDDASLQISMSAGAAWELHPATVAFAVQAADASPVPVPRSAVSPAAPGMY